LFSGMKLPTGLYSKKNDINWKIVCQIPLTLQEIVLL